jgi:hypothetical protein
MELIQPLMMLKIINKQGWLGAISMLLQGGSCCSTI